MSSLVSQGDRTLVLGGDCSTLLGVSLGLAMKGRHGLVHIDGRTNFRHPGNSTSVENLAGEDLACAVGLHYPHLSDINGLAPYIDPANVIHVGCRDGDENLAESREVLGTVIPASEWSAHEDRVLAAFAAMRRRTDLAGYWVHVDVDVLDPSPMPAVDSPDPGGSTPDLLTRGLAELWKGAAGMTVGILDPDARYARLIADVIVSAVD